MSSSDAGDPGLVKQSEVLAGLSYALDLTEGQRPGHSVRSCLIGMRLGDVFNLPSSQRSALFYALLMKDLGCSSNSARFAALFGNNDHDIKADIKNIDWTRALDSFKFVVRNVAPGQFFLKRTWRLLAVMARGPEGAREVVRTRCERGADIATMLGLAEESVQAIRALDEHWDGMGQPYSKKGEEIPLLARILNLAQTFEVFFSTHGIQDAYHMAAARRGTWFDPETVDALFTIRTTDPFWQHVAANSDVHALAQLEPDDQVITVDEDRLDLFATAFARVIDAKSPWTFSHSNGVADTAVALAYRLGFTPSQIRVLRRSALLHDLGKLGISNLILDKPEKLTNDEYKAMQKHTEHTAAILARVPCFAAFAAEAAGHHERLDGRGYHFGLRGHQISLTTRILAVADICDALRASRPYRAGLPTERVLDIIGREAGASLDAEVVAALHSALLDPSVDQPLDVPAARLDVTLEEDYKQAA
ncbi:MAG: HD domain-containing phosphohydrolase [Vicinamibacterales bacterium]